MLFQETVPSPPPILSLLKIYWFIYSFGIDQACICTNFVWTSVMGFVVKSSDKYSARLAMPEALNFIVGRNEFFKSPGSLNLLFRRVGPSWAARFVYVAQSGRDSRSNHLWSLRLSKKVWSQHQQELSWSLCQKDEVRHDALQRRRLAYIPSAV